MKQDVERETEAGDPTTFEVASPLSRGPKLTVSRSIAVDRVFRGGLLTLAGLASFGLGIANFSYVASYIFGFTGIAVAGVGLGMIGAAARHFARFGSRRVTLALGATVGLGVSVILWGLGALGPVLEQWPVLWRLQFPATLSLLGFSLLIFLLTFGALLRWMLPTDDT